MIDILNEYCDRGLLMKSTHPTKNLIIWNYTKKTNYEGHWDDITLMCRGLVTDDCGNIISRSFPKFFNWFEIKELPHEPFDVTEKMDGHLGCLFFHQGEWIFMSRGSFTSEYAIKGFELLQKYQYKKLNIDYTYVFEIIYDEGQVVCKYNFDDVILIGCFNNTSGIEKLIHSGDFYEMGFNVVKKIDGISDLDHLKSTIRDDMEGYVVKFRSGLRIKIKGDKYFTHHSLVTRITNRSIWKHLKNNKTIDDLLVDVPDEFYPWIEREVKKLNEMYTVTDFIVQKKFIELIGNTHNKTRKEVADMILNCNENLRPIFFNIYDGKDYSHLIWDRLYPKKQERPYVLPIK